MSPLRHLALCVVLVGQLAMSLPVSAQEAEPEASPPAEASIPFREDEIFASQFLLRVLLVTALGVAIAVAAAWALRRYFHRVLPTSGSDAEVRLVSFRKLTPRMSVFVIEVDGHRFAVVESGDSLVQVPLPNQGETDDRQTG